MGGYIGVAVSVGNPEMAHESGIQSLWYFLGIFIGNCVLVFGFAKFFQTIRKLTVGEAFAVLFDRKTRLAAVLAILITSAIGMGNSGKALGTVVAPLLNIPLESGAYLSTAIIVVLTIMGLRGIAWMNIFHLFVITISFIIATAASVNAIGGLGTLLASLPAEHLNIARPGWPIIVAWVVSGAGMRIIATHNVAAMYAAKDVKNAQIGGVSAAFFYVFFAGLTSLIGLAAYVIMPDIPSKLALWEMGKYLGVGMSALISIGVIAAITSTTPMIWLGLTSMATRDVFLVLKPEASERAQLAFSRIFVPVIAFPSTWFALTQPSILGFLLKMIQTRFSIQILFLIAVLWRRPHPTAAFWTIIMGSASGVVWFLAGSPFGLEPLWPGAGIGLLTLIITSLRNRPSLYKGVEGL